MAEPQLPIEADVGGGPSARRTRPRIVVGRQRLTASNDNRHPMGRLRLALYLAALSALAAAAALIASIT